MPMGSGSQGQGDTRRQPSPSSRDAQGEASDDRDAWWRQSTLVTGMEAQTSPQPGPQWRPWHTWTTWTSSAHALGWQDTEGLAEGCWRIFDELDDGAGYVPRIELAPLVLLLEEARSRMLYEANFPLSYPHPGPPYPLILWGCEAIS